MESEILFEGEITTTPDTGWSNKTNQSELFLLDRFAYLFTENDIIRLTVNGEANIFSVVDYSGIRYVGNLYVHIPYETSSGSIPDNGFDYCVATWTSMIGDTYWAFNSRTSGTYSVKIERLTTSAQPIDPNSMLAGYLVGCRLRSMRGK